jgi:Zn-dependent peptidase ImmA (M78 family)
MTCYVPSLDTWFLFRDLPKGAGGFITRDGEDTNYIVINSNLSENKKITALIHEFVHLYRGDLDSDEDIDQIEREVIIEQ